MKCAFYLLIITFLLLPVIEGRGQNITSIAGNGSYGSSGDGGEATAATFSNIIGITTDYRGNVYVSDRDANRVRKISPSGIVTAFAGGSSAGIGDGGPATAANIYQPFSLAADKYGNIYICDQGNNLIRKVDTTGIITTVAGTGGYMCSGDGGDATDAEIGNPCGVAIDIRGNLYIGSGSGWVRKVNTSGIITSFAGSDTAAGFSGDGGMATAALLANAGSVAVDTNNNVYIADYGNNRIRKVNSSGIISTFAGYGITGSTSEGAPATAAKIHWPACIATDIHGNILVTTGNQVRKINAITGIINTVAGNDTASGYTGDGGPATAATLALPQSVTVHSDGNIYIGDYFNYRVRKITNNHAPFFHYGHTQSITVCENSSAMSLNSILSGTDVDTGQTITWSVLRPPANGVVTISFSAIATGSLIIPSGLTYMPDTGYSGSDSFVVILSDGWLCDTMVIYNTIIPILITSAISGPTDLCAGTSYSYSCTPHGGAWFVTTGLTVSGSSVTGLYPGTANISYIVSNMCSADTSTLNVTVWPVVAPAISITGPDNICAATPATFLATATGGGTSPTYEWHKNGGYIGADSSIYTADSLITGDYISCTFISNAHCATSSVVYSATIHVIVHPNVVPSVSISGYSGELLCAGTSITLSAVPTNGGSSPFVRWSKDGMILGTGMLYNDTPSNGDVIKCEMISSAICPVPSTAADSTVAFVVAPVLTPYLNIFTTHDTAAYAGQVITFYAEETYGGSATLYQWFLNGTPVAGATDYSYSMPIYDYDTVYCIATSNLPCITSSTDTSNQINIYPGLLVINDIASLHNPFLLFPNPNNGNFTLQGASKSNVVTYKIFNILGTLLKEEKVIVNQGQIFQHICLNNTLPDGQYFMRVQSDTDNEVLHFVIRR